MVGFPFIILIGYFFSFRKKRRESFASAAEFVERFQSTIPRTAVKFIDFKKSKLFPFLFIHAAPLHTLQDISSLSGGKRKSLLSRCNRLSERTVYKYKMPEIRDDAVWRNKLPPFLALYNPPSIRLSISCCLIFLFYFLNGKFLYVFLYFLFKWRRGKIQYKTIKTFAGFSVIAGAPAWLEYYIEIWAVFSIWSPPQKYIYFSSFLSNKPRPFFFNFLYNISMAWKPQTELEKTVANIKKREIWKTGICFKAKCWY